MESIVRAALAAGGPGRFLSFQKMPSDGGAADPAALGEIDPPEPPPSPSPAVRFASPVAIPLAAKDKLRHAPSPLAAVTGAGLEDVEAPVWPPPPTGGSDGLQPDYMAMTVSSIVGERFRAASSQNADLVAMALIGASAFIYSLCVTDCTCSYDGW